MPSDGMLGNQFDAAASVAAVFSGRALGAATAIIDEVVGMVWIVARQPEVAWVFTTHNGQITRIDMIADSDALADAHIGALS